MLVRLTHHQFRQIELRMPELYAETMREHRTTAGRTQHDYDMPAIAWRTILDVMTAQCYGPAGGKLKAKGRPSDSAYAAIRRVAEAVKRIEGHPALRDAAVEGWVGDVIPAWTDPLGVRRIWNPYPFRVEGLAKFVLLAPFHSRNLGMKITRWEPSGMPAHFAGDSWTMRSETHLLFSRDRAAV